MKRLLLFLFLCVSGLGAQGQKIHKLDERWLYITTPLKWERGYRPGQPAPKLAYALILAFEPKGSYYELSCRLFKNPDGSLTIEYSEGYTLLSGTWQNEGQKIRTRSRILYANVWGLDRSNPEREDALNYASAKEPGRVASWLRSSEHKLKFVPLRKLSEVDGLARVIDFHKTHPVPPPK